MRAPLRIIGVLLGLSLGLLAAVPAQAASIVVSPQSAQPGGTVTVSGNVLVPPNNGVPGELSGGPAQLTVFSTAFPGGTNTVPGSWNIIVGQDARFSGQVPIRSDAPPGDYTVTGRFAGANIGASGRFTVAGAAPRSPVAASPGAPATAQPASPAPTQQPASPSPSSSTSTSALQLPSWWPAALAGLLILVLAPWVGIALLWRRLR
jgi:hypothetical protein